VNEHDPALEDGGARTTVDPDAMRFGPDGLLPAVIVDVVDRSVLMLAWMSRESLERSIATGFTVFWSRSRSELWAKGATSGHVQRIVGIVTDCDADALVITVEQTGVACHTGERSCFYRPVSS
jgi:phosphoribosyl-AMP cyclohydrolase / phosphoribosyl-ATP pyrophosphohydrolase